MNRKFFTLALSLALVLSLLLPRATLAWDSVGHRLTAAVALSYLSDATQAEVLALLEGHPRYREDFLDAMPDLVANDPDRRAQWLLGQAAYWPDIARGLPERAQERYNRPTWHYTDGAWVRGAAPLQGNSYVGVARFADIAGEDQDSVRGEDQVHNVVTALDYNTRLLANADADPAQRAVALCWVLHLMGDIHQPLHTGSLFSADYFSTGDRGGNGIRLDDGGNLHSRWDGALREEGIDDSLPAILQQIEGFSRPRIAGVASDWTSWMSESRQLLQSIVYSDAMKTEIAAADAAGREPSPASLSADYLQQMKHYARQRLGLAGLRIAIWFENELP